MSEPMSAERLAEIRNRLEHLRVVGWSGTASYIRKTLTSRDVPGLLDEVERLTQENAQLCDTIVRDREANREIGEAIANENASLRAQLEAANGILREAAHEFGEAFCKFCKYADRDGDEIPCIECTKDNEMYEMRDICAENAPPDRR